MKTGIFLAIVLLGLAGQIHAQTPVPEATNLWSLKVSDQICRSSPALAPDGTLYQATFDGTLLAINPQGVIRWKFDTGTDTDIESSPAIADDGTIYFGSRNRKFYAVTPEGKLKWTFPTGAWVDSSPAIAADGTLYFGSWDMNFYALDPSGAQKWKLAVGAIVISSPAIGADGTIYFGALDKNFYALTPDGKVKWTYAAGGEITSSPAIGADGTLYFTAADGNLYAIKRDGKEQWRVPTGGYAESSPILDEKGNAFVAGYSEVVVSPDGQSLPGSGLAHPVDVAAVAVTDRVYWSRPWRTLQAFHSNDKINGDVLWEADLPEDLTGSPVVGPDGVVCMICGRTLYVIRPAGEALPPAKSSWPMFRANPRHTGRVGNL